VSILSKHLISVSGNNAGNVIKRPIAFWALPLYNPDVIKSLQVVHEIGMFDMKTFVPHYYQLKLDAPTATSSKPN
jgi:hypothetical protein